MNDQIFTYQNNDLIDRIINMQAHVATNIRVLFYYEYSHSSDWIYE